MSKQESGQRVCEALFLDSPKTLKWFFGRFWLVGLLFLTGCCKSPQVPVNSTPITPKTVSIPASQASTVPTTVSSSPPILVPPDTSCTQETSQGCLDFKDFSLSRSLFATLPDQADRFCLFEVKKSIFRVLQDNRWHPNLLPLMSWWFSRADQDSRLECLRLLKSRTRLDRSSAGLKPLHIESWLIDQSLGKGEELAVLEWMNESPAPGREAARNYLTQRHRQIFGSNYLLWSHFLARP